MGGCSRSSVVSTSPNLFRCPWTASWFLTRPLAGQLPQVFNRLRLKDVQSKGFRRTLLVEGNLKDFLVWNGASVSQSAKGGSRGELQLGIGSNPIYPTFRTQIDPICSACLHLHNFIRPTLEYPCVTWFCLCVSAPFLL